MIHVECSQSSPEWYAARAGVTTASRFCDAISTVGGLTAQQKLYVDAILTGASESIAKAFAGYRARPTSQTIEKALSGLPVEVPSEASEKYAWLIALERIAGMSLDDTFVTWQMRRGTELEPVARRMYEARTGYWVEKSGFILTDDRRFGYSSDGLVEVDGKIEIKCPAATDKIALVWVNPREVIKEYIDQINGGLWITGRKWCDLVIYTPWLESVGKDLFIHRIHRDDDAINTLEAALWKFSVRVDANEAALRAPLVAA